MTAPPPVRSRSRPWRSTLTPDSPSQLTRTLARLPKIAELNDPVIAGLIAAYRNGEMARTRIYNVARRPFIGRVVAIPPRYGRDQLLATIDYLLVSLETLPLKFTRLQLLRVEACDYQPGDDPAYEATPLFNDLEAIEEVFVQTP